jgi:hypothetical protein
LTSTFFAGAFLTAAFLAGAAFFTGADFLATAFLAGAAFLASAFFLGARVTTNCPFGLLFKVLQTLRCL